MSAAAAMPSFFARLNPNGCMVVVGVAAGHQVTFGARANCGLQVACWHQVDLGAESCLSSTRCATPCCWVAGDKSGRWQEWYRKAIPAAEAAYEAYLKERR